MIFRKPCTWLIVSFVIFNLFFFKKLEYSKKNLTLITIIASPFLLETFLFWNNDSYLLGIKSLEKSISLIIFPLFIIGNFQRIQFNKICRVYAISTTYIILFFFFRFLFFSPELISKYLKRIDLWEMGYQFTNSFGIHAPALNMHLAFVSIINLYFIIYSFQKKEKIIFSILNIITFAFSFFLILFVNTRLALFNALFGFGLIFFYEIIKKYNFRIVIGTLVVLSISLTSIFYVYVQKNPYMKEKYYKVTFAHMDKVGKLDEIENPEAEVYNSFVTRLSIWKSAWELSLNNLPFGVGASDGKPELFKYYRQTNQKFLAEYDFPTHNQYIDYFLKFGILGIVIIFMFFYNLAYLGFSTKSPIIISFFFLFFLSNITDDYLIRFDGIAFCGLWISIFGCYWLQRKRLSVNTG
jgi:O-antigen ligase